MWTNVVKPIFYISGHSFKAKIFFLNMRKMFHYDRQIELNWPSPYQFFTIIKENKTE